jgi:hypothetical protein
MKYRNGFIFLVFALAGFCAIGAQTKPLSCAARWGTPGVPLVKKADTAKAIFLAVEQDLNPRANPSSFPDVTVDDEGGAWSVFRGRAPHISGNGDFDIMNGGGQLAMRIAKCDGHISNVSFSR